MGFRLWLGRIILIVALPIAPVEIMMYSWKKFKKNWLNEWNNIPVQNLGTK